jgi:hypothetical protein
MSNATYSLPHIEAHPSDFLGPAVMSVFLQALQTGYIIALAIRFCETAHREPHWTRALVAFVCATALYAQTDRFNLKQNRLICSKLPDSRFFLVTMEAVCHRIRGLGAFRNSPSYKSA